MSKIVDIDYAEEEDLETHQELMPLFFTMLCAGMSELTFKEEPDINLSDYNCQMEQDDDGSVTFRVNRKETAVDN